MDLTQIARLISIGQSLIYTVTELLRAWKAANPDDRAGLVALYREAFPGAGGSEDEILALFDDEFDITMNRILRANAQGGVLDADALEARLLALKHQQG